MKRVSSTASELNDFTEDEGKKFYNVSRSRLVSLINWVHVAGTYLPYIWFAVVGVLVVQMLRVMYELRFNLVAFYNNEISEISLARPVAFDLGWKSMALLALLIWYINHREKPVYLVDFVTWEPPESWKLSHEQIMQAMEVQGCFTEESLDFMRRMLAQSGVGPSTAWPPCITQCLDNKLQDRSANAARAEAEEVIYDTVGRLLKRTKTKAADIDILVINCSLFSPTPSPS